MKKMFLILSCIVIFGFGCSNTDYQATISDEITQKNVVNDVKVSQELVTEYQDRLVISSVKVDNAFFGLPQLSNERTYYESLLNDVRSKLDRLKNSPTQDLLLIQDVESALEKLEVSLEEDYTVNTYYSGIVTTSQEGNSCIKKYSQNDKFGSFQFEFPCTWDIDNSESGYVQVWSPDKTAYIKYPGYYLSHVDSEGIRERTMVINENAYTILDVHVDGDIKYSLISPAQGDLNNVGIEDLNRDNNNILIQYSEANQETINEIIQTFDF